MCFGLAVFACSLESVKDVRMFESIISVRHVIVELTVISGSPVKRCSYLINRLEMIDLVVPSGAFKA